MPESIRIARRVRRLVSAAFVLSVAFACTTVVARAAEPIVTIGSTTSPTGSSTPTGTVNSGGETDVCLDQQHSGANPGGAAPTGLVLLADRSCTATAGSPSGTPSGSDSGGGGGTQSSTGSSANGSTQTSTSRSTTSSRTGTTTTRQGANASNTSTRSSRASTRASVAAASARGLKITQVRYKVLRTKAGKRLHVLVTVRDRQLRPVRAAIISLARVAGAKRTIPGLRLGLSNRKGQTAFAVALTKPMFGQRMLLRIGARTPSTRVLKVGTFVVPKQPLQRKAGR